MTDRRDQGFTLVELVVVSVLVGMIAITLALVTSVILRSTPATEFRIDDARSTRGLQTWLSHDVASAPPIEKLVGSFGGYDVHTTAPNTCGGSGVNVAHISWQEDDGSVTTYVANYRLVGSGNNRQVIRYACQDSGAGFGAASEARVATGVSGSRCAGFDVDHPYAQLVTTTNDNNTPADTSDDYVEAEVSFCLVSFEADSGLNAGGGATQEIMISVASRNPSDFF